MSLYSNFPPRLLEAKRRNGYSDYCDPNTDDDSYPEEAKKRVITHKKRIFTPAELEQISSLYRSGYSTYELAGKYNCHRSAISRVLKDAGIIVSNKVTDRPALVERVLQMYLGGMHVKEIASQIGITPKSVSKILHDNGLRIRHSTEYVR